MSNANYNSIDYIISDQQLTRGVKEPKPFIINKALLKQEIERLLLEAKIEEIEEMIKTAYSYGWQGTIATLKDRLHILTKRDDDA